MTPSPPDWILGFDVGGTKVAVTATTREGTVLEKSVFASEASRGFDHMWQHIRTAGLQTVHALGKPEGVGVSVGGPLDPWTGVVLGPPNLPGWEHVPLGDLMTESFGCPVVIEHDAKAFALAEWQFGAGIGLKSLVYLTFGTGLGAGLILDGRLYRGRGSLAGDVGHWSISETGPYVYGKVGSWEGWASGAGLPELARLLLPDVDWPDGMSAKDLVSWARAGEARAIHVVARSAEMLGHGIALLIDLLAPEAVVLGGLAVHAPDMFMPGVRQRVAAEVGGPNIDCAVVPSALGSRGPELAPLAAFLYRTGIGSA